MPTNFNMFKKNGNCQTLSKLSKNLRIVTKLSKNFKKNFKKINKLAKLTKIVKVSKIVKQRILFTDVTNFDGANMDH